MPCGRRLASGQYWNFCGESDMGGGSPVLCRKCGGSLKLKGDYVEPPPRVHPWTQRIVDWKKANPE